MKKMPLIFIFILSIGFVGCSSSLWMLQDDPALDRSEGELISSRHMVKSRQMPTQSNPVLILDLYDRIEYEYPIRQISKRYVQQYRPRYTYLFLGLGTAAMAFYLANSPNFDDNLGQEGKLALNIGGGVLTIASILNMKPVGEPFDAGESKLLRKVGIASEVDTVRSASHSVADVQVSAWHNDVLLASGIPLAFQDGELSVNLIEHFDMETIEMENPGSIHLEVALSGQVYDFTVEVESFMEKFVAIHNHNTPLRSSPSDNEFNIVTNIGVDSQFPFDENGEEWYRVIFGISPVYVSKDDAHIIWRPGNVDVDDLIMNPGVSEFGDIDIENAIPATGAENPNGLAVLIGNGTYGEPLNSFNNVNRSLELMQNYLVTTLGYSPENVIMIQDATAADLRAMINQADSTTFLNRQIRPDTTDVIVYYMGHAVADRRNDIEAYLLPSDYNFSSPSQRIVSARNFFGALGQLKTRSTVILMETDFLLLDADGNPQFSQNQRRGILLRELSSLVTNNNPNSGVFFAANRTQRAGIYASPDGRTDYKHGIFTYYFAKALMDGQSTTGQIFGSMQRNMSFTSRRLYDRAQDPQFFGNANVRLFNNLN